jgi:diadenylate cyclase
MDDRFIEWMSELERYSKNIAVDEEFKKVIQLIAPGMPLRTGIDYIVQAKLGGLIVLGFPKKKGIMEIGFEHNKDFTPTGLYELSKMDGALVLTKNADKILYSNVHLHPSTLAKSTETGTRHRVAERFAKETGLSVLAISKKRNVVTLFFKNIKYSLKYIPELLAEASQAVITYEHYIKKLSDRYSAITISEIKGTTTLQDIVNGILQYLKLKKILWLIERKIIELGEAGRLLKMRIDELSQEIKDGVYLIRDYITDENKIPEDDIINIFDMFAKFNYLEPLNILSVLGYQKTLVTLEKRVEPRGYRMLLKIPKIPENTIEKIIEKFPSFQKIFAASQKELVEVEGVGDVRASLIKEEMLKLRDNIL